MERRDFNDAGLDWASLIEHVARDNTPVEIERNNVPLVRITPVRRPITMADLNEIFAKAPRLGDDAEAFARDVEEYRNSLQPPKDPWES